MSHSTKFTDSTGKEWTAIHNAFAREGNVRWVRADDGHQITIPAELMLEYTANVIRDERVAALEQAEVEELLNLKTRTPRGGAHKDKDWP